MLNTKAFNGSLTKCFCSPKKSLRYLPGSSGCLRFLRFVNRQAEISDNDAQVFIERPAQNDVIALQVPMNHSVSMSFGQSCTQLPHNFQGLIGSKATARGQES